MASFAPAQLTMGFKEIGIAFAAGFVTGGVIVALARNHTVDFSLNPRGVRFHLGAGKSGEMSKRQLTPDEEPKNETSDEEPGDETNPGDSPNGGPDNSPKDGNSPGAAGFSPVPQLG